MLSINLHLNKSKQDIFTIRSIGLLHYTVGTVSYPRPRRNGSPAGKTLDGKPTHFHSTKDLGRLVQVPMTLADTARVIFPKARGNPGNLIKVSHPPLTRK